MVLLAWAGHLPSAGQVPCLLLAEGEERAPTAACTPACTPASPVLPGLPPGQVIAGPGASRGCKARTRTKASSPLSVVTEDTAPWCWWPWGHPCSPAVLSASRSGADALGRLWDAGSLARPLKRHVLPLSAALLAGVTPAVAAVMLWYFSFLLLNVTRHEQLNRFE